MSPTESSGSATARSPRSKSAPTSISKSARWRANTRSRFCTTKTPRHQEKQEILSADDAEERRFKNRGIRGIHGKKYRKSSYLRSIKPNRSVPFVLICVYL